MEKSTCKSCKRSSASKSNIPNLNLHRKWSKSGSVDTSWLLQVVSTEVRSHKRQSSKPSSFLKKSHEYDGFCTIRVRSTRAIFKKRRSISLEVRSQVTIDNTFIGRAKTLNGSTPSDRLSRPVTRPDWVDPPTFSTFPLRRSCWIF